jgi:acetoin utilization deacetylase AcuC-like enzyme
MVGIDQDTWMNPHSWQAALRAAGAVVMAVDLVMQKQSQAVFCNVRPPGHHAEHDRAMGFCLFNNVAVGVAHAIGQHQLERVAIIDFDVHHGNGTQNIFQNNPKVLLCSSFQHPFYPGYDKKMDNTHILNVPLDKDTTGDLYREKIRSAWFEKLAAFRPQMVFFSAGFDAHRDDPVGQLKLTEEDFAWVTEQIVHRTQEHCEGRIVSVLEGGYNLEVLAACVPAHVKAIIG